MQGRMGTLRKITNFYKSDCHNVRRVRARLADLTLICTVLFLCMISNSIAVTAQTKSANEYQVKAAFLYNFAKFIDWPPSAFNDAKQPLEICVYGHDPFGAALEDALLGKAIGDRRVALGRAMLFQDLAGCHVVFGQLVGTRIRRGLGQSIKRPRSLARRGKRRLRGLRRHHPVHD